MTNLRSAAAALVAMGYGLGFQQKHGTYLRMTTPPLPPTPPKPLSKRAKRRLRGKAKAINHG